MFGYIRYAVLENGEKTIWSFLPVELDGERFIPQDAAYDLADTPMYMELMGGVLDYLAGDIERVYFNAANGLFACVDNADNFGA